MTTEDNPIAPTAPPPVDDLDLVTETLRAVLVEASEHVRSRPEQALDLLIRWSETRERRAAEAMARAYLLPAATEECKGRLEALRYCIGRLRDVLKEGES